MCCVKTSIDLTFEYLMSYRKYLTEYFQKTNRHVLITVQVARNFKQVYHLPGVVYRRIRMHETSGVVVG